MSDSHALRSAAAARMIQDNKSCKCLRSQTGEFVAFQETLIGNTCFQQECTFCFRPAVVAPGLNSDALCHALVFCSNIIIHSVHPTVSGQNQNVTKCKYCSFIIVGMPCSLLVIPPSVSCPQVEVVGSMLVPARHTQEYVLQYRSGWWHASLCLLCQAYPRVCPTPRPSPSFTH